VLEAILDPNLQQPLEVQGVELWAEAEICHQKLRRFAWRRDLRVIQEEKLPLLVIGDGF